MMVHERDNTTADCCCTRYFTFYNPIDFELNELDLSTDSNVDD